MWVMHLGLIFHLRLFKSPMDYYKMNLHASIACKFWFSLKGHPNYILVYFEMTLHVGIAFKVRFTPHVT